MRLHWTFQSPQHLFLVMTYVGGGELYELMERHLSLNGKPMPVPWARFYAAELALALEHLHSHGILYRDLKPENVLLGLDGHVCLTDFGLAMALDEEEIQVCGACLVPKNATWMTPATSLESSVGSRPDKTYICIVCDASRAAKRVGQAFPAANTA